MTTKQKILVCGDAEGKFKNLFKKVETFHTKSGPFDLLLCVGNFFGVNNSEFAEFKSGLKKVAVPTYVLGPNLHEHIELYSDTNSDLCSNVTYLGKRGVFNTSGGLKIAYLSGVCNNDSKSKSKLNEFNKDDVLALRDMCVKANIKYRGVDILLTSQWPKDITNLDNTKQVSESTNTTELISWLAFEIKPRYHISGLEGIYYERPPYRNIDSNGETKEGIQTRFIGLARVCNSNNQKWIYALNLTPIEMMRNHELTQKTTDETLCPYNSEMLLKLNKPSKNVQYFYNMSCDQEKTGIEKPRKRSKPNFDQSKCWFCLGSPNVEKHLVISVGEHCYLALAKGGLVNEHLLILPIEHYQSYITLPDAVKDEIDRFREALKKFFDAQEKYPIFFERNFKTSHLQIQTVPVSINALKEIKDVFHDEAEASGIKLDILPDGNRLDQVIQENSPYFCVELPDVRLYTRCKQNFPLQFGREVLASGPILDIPEKSDWKECILPRHVEELLIQKIRKSFEPFDFTL